MLYMMMVFVMMGFGESRADEPAAPSGPAVAPPSEPLRPSIPKVVVGPSASLGLALASAKPAGLALGAQAIIPVKAWRIGAEVFMSSPVTGFTPALGGDLGLGLVNGQGLGGAVAFYGRYVFATEAAPGGAQLGPGITLLSKVAPTVVMMTPLVVWIDPSTGAVTPSLSYKVVFGVPYGR